MCICIYTNINVGATFSFQLSTTRAARAAQGCTDDGVRVDTGTLCENDEVAKSGGTGITILHIDILKICFLGREPWTA